MDADKRYALYLASAILGWLIGAVVFWLLVGCAHSAPVKPAPLEVKITNLPERTQVTCWLPDVPVAPPLKELNYEDDDLVRRVFVHYLDYNAMVQWSMETQTWMQEAQRCFNRLTGVEE